MLYDKPMRSSDQPVLSICIPTYNRADCLHNCLATLERASLKCRDQIEVIVSDNASTDHTPDVVEKWKAVFPIRYLRNPTNIGAERNFFSAANHAIAEYLWIFGDDDDFGDDAVTEILHYIVLNYDLIVANYSSWSKDMDEMLPPSAIFRGCKTEYDDPELILSTFALHMGFISSVVVRKSILLSTPPAEYEVFVPYGFPFPFCVYCGIRKGVRMAFLPTPLFRARQHNSSFEGPAAANKWLKFFSEGPALVFEALSQKGYSPSAIRRAKTRTLRDFGVGNILYRIEHVDRKAVRTMMSRHYWASWRYWTAWLPFLVLPKQALKVAIRAYHRLRGRGSTFQG